MGKKPVALALHPEMLARVDTARDGLPRNAWLEQAVEDALVKAERAAREANRTARPEPAMPPQPGISRYKCPVPRCDFVTGAPGVRCPFDRSQVVPISPQPSGPDPMLDQTRGG